MLEGWVCQNSPQGKWEEKKSAKEKSRNTEINKQNRNTETNVS